MESKRFGLTVSTVKMEVQCIPSEDQPMLLSIQGETLKQSSDFVNLGSKMSYSADLSADITSRIGLATGVGRSLARIWTSKEIGIPTKVRALQYTCAVGPVVQRRDMDDERRVEAETTRVQNVLAALYSRRHPQRPVQKHIY